MEIHVIQNDRQGESADLMAFIKASIPSTAAPYVFAEAYAADGLVEALEVRIARGERGILALGCSREQVQAVLEWSSCEEESQLQDLEIFLVRRA